MGWLYLWIGRLRLFGWGVALAGRRETGVSLTFEVGGRIKFVPAGWGPVFAAIFLFVGVPEDLLGVLTRPLWPPRGVRGGIRIPCG